MAWFLTPCGVKLFINHGFLVSKAKPNPWKKKVEINGLNDPKAGRTFSNYNPTNGS
jgi:hypothetical protein